MEDKMKFYEIANILDLDLEYDGDETDLRLHGREKLNWGAETAAEYEEANAVREPYCPGCQVVGHTLRDGDCPKFWWCKKCEWGHNNNDVCDNKAAKNEFLRKKGERKSGGGGGRGSGGRGGN
jgi:hypothetical protein